MRKLLIVDDERNIRNGLKSMIERQYPDRYDMSFAADGEEALSMLRSNRIDVMITDIRMPVLDGLALIRLSAETAPKTAVIILSGHEDFQYAKEAIRFNVKEYLLKPIVREHLYNALDRVEQELNRSDELEERLGDMDRVRAELCAAQLNYIYVHPAIDPTEAAERCRSAGLDRLESGYYTGVLKFAGENRQNVLAHEFLARWDHTTGLFYLEDKDGYLVILSGELNLYEQLMAYLTKKCISAYHIGLSRWTERLEAVRNSYMEARQAAGYSLLQPRSHSTMIRYDSIMEREDDMQVPIDEIRKLANMLGTDREQEMKALLVGLFDLNPNVSLRYIEQLSKQLNELVFDDVFRQYGEESVEILRLYKQVGNINHYSDIHDYFHQAETLLFQLNEYVRTVRSALGDNREMKKALQYIHEHYHRDLNMTTVSNHVSLNYSYFSELFKEYTGQSFVSYVKAVRIAKAKELLEETNEKIYEIGRKVGFESAKQFNRVFRELEGISVSEYRSKRQAAGHTG